VALADKTAPGFETSTAKQFAEKYQVRQQNDRQQVGNPQPGPNLENSLLATESPKMSFSANCKAAFNTSGAKAPIYSRAVIAALEALRHPKSEFSRSLSPDAKPPAELRSAGQPRAAVPT